MTLCILHCLRFYYCFTSILFCYPLFFKCVQISIFIFKNLSLKCCLVFSLRSYLSYLWINLLISSKITLNWYIVFNDFNCSIFRSNYLSDIHRLVHNISIWISYNFNVNDLYDFIFSFIFDSCEPFIWYDISLYVNSNLLLNCRWLSLNFDLICTINLIVSALLNASFICEYSFLRCLLF